MATCRYGISLLVFNFSDISRVSAKVVRRPDEGFRTFPENFGRLAKKTEDFRGRNDVSIIQQHI